MIIPLTSIIVILTGFYTAASTNKLWDEKSFHLLTLVNASSGKLSCICEFNDSYVLTPCSPTFADHSCHFYLIRNAMFNIAPNQAYLYQTETVTMIFNRLSRKAVQMVHTETGDHRQLILEPGNATCSMKQIFVFKAVADKGATVSFFLMAKASCVEGTTREFVCIYDPWANRFNVVDDLSIPSSNDTVIHLMSTDAGRQYASRRWFQGTQGTASECTLSQGSENSI